MYRSRAGAPQQRYRREHPTTPMVNIDTPAVATAAARPPPGDLRRDASGDRGPWYRIGPLVGLPVDGRAPNWCSPGRPPADHRPSQPPYQHAPRINRRPSRWRRFSALQNDRCDIGVSVSVSTLVVCATTYRTRASMAMGARSNGPGYGTRTSLVPAPARCLSQALATSASGITSRDTVRSPRAACCVRRR